MLCVIPSFNEEGFMKAPWVDGVDTKSQHNNSKSSSTSTFPSPNCFTEPIPLDDIPTVMLFKNNCSNGESICLKFFQGDIFKYNESP